MSNNPAMSVGQEMDAEGTPSAGYLACESYAALFHDFEKSGISWCSWKSNEHLSDGLTGKTDIDILFNDGDQARVRAIMRKNNFIEFKTPAYRYYPGITDFVSVDVRSGRILHAHAHFLLTLGEKNLKSFVFPWAPEILAQRVRIDEKLLIYSSSPVDELILLLVRESIKSGRPDPEKYKAGIQGTGFYRELMWLRDRVALHEIEKRAGEMLDLPAAEIICELVSGDVTHDLLCRLGRCVRQRADEKQWRRMGGALALFQKNWRTGLALSVRLLEKAGVPQHLIVRRRVLPGEGLVVAMVGPDGSGKSTLSKKIVSQYANKIDVALLYFGAGDGAQTAPQWILKSVVRAAMKLRRRQHGIGSTGEKTSPAGGAADDAVSGATILSAVTGVWHKRSIMKKAKALKSRGFIVVCDRWPQNQVSGMNDGPLLSGLMNDKRSFMRFLARWEERQFERICGLCGPDLVLLMSPSLKTAVQRKPENREMEDIIRRKIEAFGRIRFPDCAAVVEVDADRPFSDVLEVAHSAIWSHMRAKPSARPAFFECVGLPGAGKTTACERIYAVTGMRPARDIFPPGRKSSIFENVTCFLESLIADPVLYLLLFIFAVSPEVRMNRQACTHLFRLPVQKIKLLKAVRRGRYLLDQMLLQNIWSALVTVGAGRVSSQALAPLVSRLYRDCQPVIFSFEISPEEASRRISQRENGESRFDGLPAADISNRLQSLSRLMQDVIFAASCAGLEVIHIDARRSTDEIIEGTMRPQLSEEL